MSSGVSRFIRICILCYKQHHSVVANKQCLRRTLLRAKTDDSALMAILSFISVVPATSRRGVTSNPTLVAVREALDLLNLSCADDAINRNVYVGKAMHKLGALLR